MSPLLFSLFLNDLEEQFISSGLEGLVIDICKMFLLLYADDLLFLQIVLLSYRKVWICCQIIAKGGR